MGIHIATFDLDLDQTEDRAGDYEKIEKYIKKKFGDDSMKIMPNTFAIKHDEMTTDAVFELIYKPHTPIGNSGKDILFVGYVPRRLGESSWVASAEVHKWLEKHL